MRKMFQLLAVALMSGAIISPATAQSGPGEGPGATPNPQQVVERCISHLGELAQRGVSAIRETTVGTVHVIGRLDEEGAEDRAILRVAKEGRERVLGAVRVTTAAINRETGMCLRILRHIEAPQGAIDAVLAARRAALGAVSSAAEHSLAAIRSAVENAIGAPARTADSAAAVQ